MILNHLMHKRLLKIYYIRKTMHNVAFLIKTITEQLLPAYHDLQLAQEHAWQLLEKVTGATKLHLITRNTINVTPEQEQLLAGSINDIVINHKPIQYIIGSVPFLDLTITVRPPILIPRPETEEWCNTFITQLLTVHSKEAQLNILDLCTGSGCIALAIAQAFPLSTVYAVDISAEALALAQENAQNNLIPNVIFIESDLYNNIPSMTFNYIVSNPPYISPEEYVQLDASVSAWEDKQALTTGNHGLEIIENIITHAPKFLHTKNTTVPAVWIEIGYQQATAVKKLFHQAGCTSDVLRDLQGNDRVVRGYLQ